jgi:hypothetical protein
MRRDSPGRPSAGTGISRSENLDPDTGARSHVFTRDELLFDYLRRLETRRHDQRALHLKLAALSSLSRRDQNLRSAAGAFEPLVALGQAQRFVLPRGDLLVFYRANAEAEIEKAAGRVRSLFADDPLLAAPSPTGCFERWFDIDRDFESVVHLARSLTEPAPAERHGNLRRGGHALTAERLDRLEKALALVDLSAFLRRQAVAAVDGRNQPETSFETLTLAIDDIREAVLPDVDLTANRWLFRHLSRTLDQRLLAYLAQADLVAGRPKLCIPLSVATILSPAFLAFDDRVGGRWRDNLIFQIDHADAIEDPAAFRFARAYTRELRFALCVSDLDPGTLGLIDTGAMGFDFVRIAWPAEMMEGCKEHQERLRAFLAERTSQEIVLTNVDRMRTLAFGRSIGIGLFQGPAVDALIAEQARQHQRLRLQHGLRRRT